MPMNVRLLRVSNRAQLPIRGTPGSAYLDLCAAEFAIVDVGTVRLITTGWRIEVPEGYFLDVRPRSGMASFGVTVNNAPGTVDADYRGELKVIVVNHGFIPYQISIGDRIAQCALMPVVPTSFEEVGELTSTLRGRKGYGSTGR